MNYSGLRQKVGSLPVFSVSQLAGLAGGDSQALRNQISRWVKQGLILRLKGGLYLLSEADRKITPSRMFLANQIYSPSYVSTEYALSMYDLIPERVADVTSITTKKTAVFNNSFGAFVYQHIDTPCFKGFLVSKDENGLSYFMAMPEKALIDFFYLNPQRFKKNQPDIFEASFRLQNLSTLKKGRLLEFARCFNNAKLLGIVRDFCKLVK